MLVKMKIKEAHMSYKIQDFTPERKYRDFYIRIIEYVPIRNVSIFKSTTNITLKRYYDRKFNEN